jgi:hypothetical protein
VSGQLVSRVFLDLRRHASAVCPVS